MKISTGQLFDRAVTQMSEQKTKVVEMQTKLATGKQIVQTSDDPDKAGLIQRLNTAYNRQETYESTLNSVEDRLSAEESSLMATDNILQRVRELAVQASSDTTSADDRAIIATEINALKDSLLALANTQDVNGNYVFSGSAVRTVPFAADGEGNMRYQGDNSYVAVDVSEQRRLIMNRPGNEVFDGVVRLEIDGTGPRKVSFFNVIEDFSNALATNDTTGIQRSLGEVDELSATLSISLADVGSRQNVVESQRDVLADTKLRYKSVLSNAEDLDYASAVTKLSAELLSLEAAQASFAKISQLTLFDYIR
ncbi:MAG: flagellar hook-associated protein FlgL [Porticoccaceae bacterium]|jgi:flagellar hook-associated protein 3 FlgL